MIAETTKILARGAWLLDAAIIGHLHRQLGNRGHAMYGIVESNIGTARA
jgi:hypothetical protein